MKIERFGRLVFIPGENGARYPYCNSLYIDDEIKAIIDPASSESILKEFHEKSGVDVIVNTHYHEDHMSLNYLFPDAELYVHEDDAPGFKSIDKLFDLGGIKGTDFEHIWHDILIDQFHYRERIPAREFRDEDILDFGHVKLKVIHTPGHTAGHSSFYWAEGGILFMGDFDLGPFGPWYGDRVSDIDKTIESMHKLMRIPAEIYITSHEKGIVRGDITEMAEAFINVIDERESRLIDFLEKPRTFEEIVNRWIIYGKPREPIDFYLFGERVMIKKHLDYLIKNGRAEIKGDRYFLT